MEVSRVVTGFLDENCYVIKDNQTCLIVDPGDDYNKIIKEVGDLKILGVLITHSHFDHIGALRNFLSKRGVKIFKKSNVEDLAEKLQIMCNDEEIVTELKNGADEFILSKYNWNDVANSTYDLYKKVLKK